MNIQKGYIKMKRIVGVGSSAILGVLLVAMLCPVGAMTASAEVTDESTTRSASTRAQTVVKPTLAIALEAADKMQITPGSASVFDNTVTNLSIATNSKNGFTVFANAVNGTSLTSASTDDEIASIYRPMEASSFIDNSWGIYAGAGVPDENSQYLPVTSTPMEITSSDTSVANQVVKVAFGVRVTADLDAGTYTNDVLVSVVANPIVVTLAEIEYMQDVTPEICSNTMIDEGHILKDKRDDKAYRVAHLKDGKCWMQQELELTLGSKGVTMLMSDTSDVEYSWFPPSDTNTEIANSVPGSWSLDTDLGKKWYYQLSTATAGSADGLVGPFAEKEASESICPRGWRLPVSGEYKTLVAAYGLPSSAGPITASQLAEFKAEPLNLVLAGKVTPAGSAGYKLDGVGNYTWYMMNYKEYKEVNSADEYYTYVFDLQNNGINSNSLVRDTDAGTVRCLAR